MKDKNVIRIKIPQKINDTVLSRIHPLVMFHQSHLGFNTIEQVIEDLTRDCYLQGLQDGVTIAKKNLSDESV